MKKINSILITLAAAFMLVACGSNIIGNYAPVGSNKTGITSLEFKSGNKLNMTSGLFGKQTIELEYEVDGKNLKVKNQGQVSIWTIRDDGSIEFMGDVFKKK